MTTSKKLRDCFGLFTTGVCIATIRFDTDKYTGITINSFSSLSLKPALLLFSISNESSNLNHFLHAESFVINILSASQQELSKAFATKHYPNRWEIEDFSTTKLKNRIFKNALGFFECKKHAVIEMGDHHIIVGEIVDFDKLNDSPALLYGKGKYVDFGNSLA